MAVDIHTEHGDAKKLAWHLRGLQPLFAIERLVANEGWVASPVKAVSRRRRGPQARLYRACPPAILGHRGRRLAAARPLRRHVLYGFAPPATCWMGRTTSAWHRMIPSTPI